MDSVFDFLPVRFTRFHSSSCLYSIPRFGMMSIEIFRCLFLFMIIFLNFPDLNSQLQSRYRVDSSRVTLTDLLDRCYGRIHV